MKTQELVDGIMSLVGAGHYSAPRSAARRLGLARLHVEAMTEYLILRGWIVASLGSLSIAAEDQRRPLLEGDIGALSAECKPNLFVHRWHGRVNAGSPGLRAH